MSESQMGERRRRREEERRRALAAQAEAAAPAQPAPPSAPDRPLSRRELRLQQEAAAAARAEQEAAQVSQRAQTPQTPQQGPERTQQEAVRRPPPQSAGDASYASPVSADPRSAEPARTEPAPRRSRRAIRESQAPEVRPPASTGGVRRVNPDGSLSDVEPQPGQSVGAVSGPRRTDRPHQPVRPGDGPAAGQEAARPHLTSPQARAAAVRAQAARAQAEREEAARLNAERAQAQRAQAQREQAAREQAAREQAQREQLMREQGQRQRAQRERAQREQAAREQAHRDQAREQAQREQAQREQDQREQAAREQAQRERAQRERAQWERARGTGSARETADRGVDRGVPHPGGGPGGGAPPGAPRDTAASPTAADLFPRSTGAGDRTTERSASSGRVPEPARARLQAWTTGERQRQVPAPRTEQQSPPRPAQVPSWQPPPDQPVAVPAVGETFAVVSAPTAPLTDPVTDVEEAQTADDAAPVPHWSSVTPGASWSPLAGDQLHRPAQPGSGDEGDDEGQHQEEAWPEEPAEEVKPQPYTWLHLVVLVVVAFVLGMLIFMVVVNDPPSDEPQSADVPAVTIHESGD